MDRTEYLKIRFRQDFLQYCLLQADSHTHTDMVNAIGKAIDIQSVEKECEEAIDRIIEKHLPLDMLKDGDKYVSDIPAMLNLEVKDTIINEYTEYLYSCGWAELVGKLLADVEVAIEKQVWENGVGNMPLAMQGLRQRLTDKAKVYADIYTELISYQELEERYNDAKANTLMERMRNSNIDDISDFRIALKSYAKTSCRNILNATIAEIYMGMANSDMLAELESHFIELLNYANDMKATLPMLHTNEQWDKEYNHKVPTDFYRRNVENVTPERAFHILLLHFFAKNEDWLTNNGMLQNGKLKIYTTPTITAIDSLLAKLEEEVFVN